MKILKTIGYSISIFLILNIIITIFSYFELFSDKIIDILKVTNYLITIISGGLLIGIFNKKKGLINGLILGLIFITISSLSIMILPVNFSFKTIIYYIFTLVLTSLGSVVGVNIKKATK